MIEAKYYKTLSEKMVQCHLCPHLCLIADGKSGICRTRKNLSGKLTTLVYGFPVAINPDPIEKKPLYHYFPGKKILSFGTMGCNLKCFYCQNCEISQASPENKPSELFKSPSELVQMAKSISNNIGIAFTYNEPVVFFEYMLETAKMARSNKLKSIMVSNGFINEEPLHELIEYIDAFNIDLKAFNDNFYRKNTGGMLTPVLNTIKTIRNSGNHLEITFLVIPGLNDNLTEFTEMVKWIRDEAGENTVLHLSRYFPRFKCNLPPTPVETILEMRKIGFKYLKYLYIGNIGNITGNNTLCSCGSTVILRNGYTVEIIGLDKKGNCTHCNNSVITNF